MSLLKELKSIFTKLDIPAETATFTGIAPVKYAVFTPMQSNYDLFADNKPLEDVEEVRISYFDKGNYNSTKKAIEKAILQADITVTDRRYVGYEENTGYHHLAIDVAKNYKTEEI